MSYHRILIGEISSLIDEMMKKKKVIIQNSITAIVCSNHAHELKQDALFSTYCINTTVRKEVGQVMNKKLLNDSSASGQLTIEGFKYVQAYYSIERDGEIQGLPLDLISREEGIAKGKELIKTGKGFIAHGDELVDYFQNIAISRYE